MSDPRDCAECGHPVGHHDAGECWTDAKGREVSGGSVCGCGWYTPRYAMQGKTIRGTGKDHT
jgi:hypothetical protein